MANRLNVQNIYASDSDTTAALTISSTDGISAPGLVGMIAAFAMSTAPSGWLVCNGGEYAIADYGDLYTAISTTWGSLTDGDGGSGTTHFRVPDLRGEFLRGWDDGAGNDPDAGSRTGGDIVGSSQSYQIESHRHSEAGTSAHNTYAGSGSVLVYKFISGNTGYTGGNETRPRNKYVQYCIKY
jgi:microcystin-dependent protein